MKTVLLTLLLWLNTAGAWASFPDAAGTYPFGVLNQRSLALTAEYWNPILRYVSAKSGVPLALRIARTANETTDLAARGELAFVYSNHFFTPKRDKLGFRVLARQDGDGIRGQIVVADDSPIRTLENLASQAVAFANPFAMAGYFVPMDRLLKSGVHVQPVFAGNQEAAMAMLKINKVVAAGVNNQVMADFGRREGFRYRVLYESEPYLDIAVMAHPQVPNAVNDKIRAAFSGMMADPEGRTLLIAAAAMLKQVKLRGFVPADDRDYDNYRRFFHHTQVPLDEQ
jgi:phosphonate transport system substrate-binding protein